MAVETELKLRLDDGSWRRLEQRLGKQATTVVQVDTFLVHPCRDLVAHGEGLRIRCQMAASPGENQAATFEVTHKGPRAAGFSKSRVETNLAAAQDPMPLFSVLGFTSGLQVRKRRRSGTILQSGALSVALHLDEVTGLGRFCEIEVVGAHAREATPLVEQARHELGLGGMPAEPRSYAEMLAAT